MTPDLELALLEVERVFGSFTSRPDNVCLHCYAESDVAPLAVAGAPIDVSTLDSLMHRNPGSVDDHAALVRRILPQMARGLADRTLEVTWPAHHCLARGDWHAWPTEQSATVRRFVQHWWYDQVTTPQTQYVPFTTYAAILGDLPAALATWPDHPVADTHLVTTSEDLISDLLMDENPLWLSDLDDDAAIAAVLRAWYIDTAADRLARVGATHLADQARLLALPFDERIRILHST